MQQYNNNVMAADHIHILNFCLHIHIKFIIISIVIIHEIYK